MSDIDPRVKINTYLNSILSNCLSACYYDRTAFDCGAEGISERSKYAHTVHGQFGFRKQRAHQDRRFICYAFERVYEELQKCHTCGTCPSL